MIRPTFLAFETAKSAITASQYGLDTVGHNMANVNTPGYTRQRVDQVSLSRSGITERYKIYGAGGVSAGYGSMVTGVNQIRDPYLDTRYRAEASTYAGLAAKLGGLTDLKDVLDEINTDGIGVQLENFINELTKFAKDPDDIEIATIVRNYAKQLTQVINKTANELEGVLNTQKNDLEVALANDVNLALEQIAYLNGKIREEHMFGNPANELMDERNLLIDQISEYVNIKVVNTPEKISEDLTISNLSIMMVDNSTAPASELMLVDKTSYNGLSMTERADGTVAVNLIDGLNQSIIKSDINISKGAVRGYMDMINGKGMYAGDGENNYRGVQYYMKALDTFAFTFAQTMNALNSITAAEANQTATIKEYDPKNLFIASDGGAITASNICISKEWEAEATHFTTSKIDPVSKEPEQAKDEDGNLLYDDNGDPVYLPDGNADNINKVIETLKGSLSFTIVNGNGQSLTLYNGSPSEFLTSMQSDLGLDRSMCNTLFNSSETVITGYMDQRDSISAVSMDEEAINLMTYQNYYNAALRYMTTIDEALGTLITGMGIVGR